MFLPSTTFYRENNIKDVIDLPALFLPSTTFYRENNIKDVIDLPALFLPSTTFYRENNIKDVIDLPALFLLSTAFYRATRESCRRPRIAFEDKSLLLDVSSLIHITTIKISGVFNEV